MLDGMLSPACRSALGRAGRIFDIDAMDLILASMRSPNPAISTKLALRRSRELTKVRGNGPASHSTTSRRRMDPFRVLGQVGLGSDSPQPSPWRERRAAAMSTHGPCDTVARWRLLSQGDWLPSLGALSRPATPPRGPCIAFYFWHSPPLPLRGDCLPYGLGRACCFGRAVWARGPHAELGGERAASE
mgnify:CR=1 FL=1